MVTRSEIEEVERFVNSFGYFYVDDRDSYIQIKGTFDDLNPEPERSEIDSALHKMRRRIIGGEFPLPVEDVSNVESRYGAKVLKVFIED